VGFVGTCAPNSPRVTTEAPGSLLWGYRRSRILSVSRRSSRSRADSDKSTVSDLVSIVVLQCLTRVGKLNYNGAFCFSGAEKR